MIQNVEADRGATGRRWQAMGCYRFGALPPARFAGSSKRACVLVIGGSLRRFASRQVGSAYLKFVAGGPVQVVLSRPPQLFWSRWEDPDVREHQTGNRYRPIPDLRSSLAMPRCSLSIRTFAKTCSSLPAVRCSLENTPGPVARTPARAIAIKPVVARGQANRPQTGGLGHRRSGSFNLDVLHLGLSFRRLRQPDGQHAALEGRRGFGAIGAWGQRHRAIDCAIAALRERNGPEQPCNAADDSLASCRQVPGKSILWIFCSVNGFILAQKHRACA